MMNPRNTVQQYLCGYTSTQPTLNGRLDIGAWASAAWTADFIDIRGSGTGAPEPRFRTRAKLLWDNAFLYVGAELEEPHVWTNISEKNSVVYWQNDFEIFVDPDADGLNYYELEVNALNTIWELTLDKPYNKGGTATHPTNIPGLVSTVHVNGTINDASDIDVGWNVQVAIPWEGLKKYNIKPPSRSTPPNIGDSWRINFSRVEWPFRIDEAGKYVRVPDENRWDVHYEDNWVWSSQGEINMHLPEKWGTVTFIGELDELKIQN
ncbi:hypothetical protein HK100_008819 [Physocladia obscura]|uniref:Carbohydrate-binding domain-containing protein n=1 Tax=Physocladia obscura TaxID=109957 RepID=A0AAD5T3R1_9FUNG|nr:hypothetical protein HK100_008819 [Physocladia obscura]